MCAGARTVRATAPSPERMQHGWWAQQGSTGSRVQGLGFRVQGAGEVRGQVAPRAWGGVGPGAGRGGPLRGASAEMGRARWLATHIVQGRGPAVAGPAVQHAHMRVQYSAEGGPRQYSAHSTGQARRSPSVTSMPAAAGGGGGVGGSRDRRRSSSRSSPSVSRSRWLEAAYWSVPAPSLGPS